MADHPGSQSRYERLERLLRLLAQNREAAKSLDMQAMDNASQALQELVFVLETEAHPLSADERKLAAHIQLEVKRCACFFRQALAWVEDGVHMVRGDVVSPGYSPTGDRDRVYQEGRLLSGRV
jgi:hypothetical protein